MEAVKINISPSNCVLGLWWHRKYFQLFLLSTLLWQIYTTPFRFRHSSHRLAACQKNYPNYLQSPVRTSFVLEFLISLSNLWLLIMNISVWSVPIQQCYTSVCLQTSRSMFDANTFGLDIRKKFFTMRVVKHWNRLDRKSVV